MKYNKIITIAAALAAVLAIASCERRPLWYEYGPLAGVDIVPNWKKAGGTPEDCQTFIYDGNGKLYTTINSKKTDAIHVELPVGEYQAVTFTYNDGKYTTLKFNDKDDLGRFNVRSNEGQTEWTVGGKKMPVGASPEWIAAGQTGLFKVTDNDASVSLIPFEAWRDGKLDHNSPGYEIPTTMTVREDVLNLVSDIEVEVWVDDIRKIRSARATIGGMAAGWNIQADKPLSDTLAVALEKWEPWNEPTYATGKITAHADCFGRPELARAFAAEDNPFDLYLSLGKGDLVFRYFAKVGHLIEDKADETWNHRRLLRLQIGTPEQPIVLPDTDSEVIGFNPWVDEWIDGGRILVNF